MAEKQQLTDHIVSVLVNNHPGVLSKVTSLITRRGFNIDGISAGNTKQSDMFRLTIVVKGDDRSIEQIQKQLYKIIDVVKVWIITPESKLDREIGLIKIKIPQSLRNEILQMINVFKASVVDAGPDGFIVEITGTSEKIDSFLSLFEHHQIVEVARSGVVAMNRWDKK